MNPFTVITTAFVIGMMPVDQSPFQGNVVVRGVVLESWHHHPIPRAIVYAVAYADVQKTVANSTGHFYFLNLPPGKYRFVGEAQGYTSGCVCCARKPVELDAGFEYDATIWLRNAC